MGDFANHLQTYPTQLRIKIADLDADLSVVSVKKAQEIVSEMPLLNKYEGASRVSGCYRGQVVQGYAYIELLGDWRM